MVESPRCPPNPPLPLPKGVTPIQIIFERKKADDKTIIVCGKKMFKIYLHTLKNDLFGCFEIEKNKAMTIKQV